MNRWLLLFLLFLCFSLVVNGQSRWETILKASDEWRYFPANSNPANNWMHSTFDDNTWLVGKGGFGYADGDDSTIVDVCNSVYLRKKFQVNSMDSVEKLWLNIDYDDGFVAYINGVKVAHSFNLLDLGGTSYNSLLTFDHEARMYQGGEPEGFPVSAAWLETGENLLAVQVINVNINSSDLSANVFLHAKVNSTDSLYNDNPEWFSTPQEITDCNLPILKINTYGQPIIDDPKIKAHLGVINNGNGQLNHVNDVLTGYNGFIGIETRGQSTQMFPKKSFSIETRDSMDENRNVPLLGLPEENDWVLYAPFSDKSMLRNAVTFELAHKLGHYASRMVFCEVFINDVYQGVYILMEKIKRDKNRVDVATLRPEDLTGDELTGGYIFKVDKVDYDYVEGRDGWTSSPSPAYPNAMDIIYQYYDPKPNELLLNQKHYLKDFIAELERALIGGDFSDPDKGYNQYLNVSSFIDYMLVAELSKEVDKYRYSTYFFKTKDSNGGEVHAGPIWDFNLGYANVDYWGFGLQPDGWLFEQVQPYDWSIMFYWKRLMEDLYFRQLASTRWQELRETLWSDAAINQVFDSLTTLVDDAQQRNYNRWPVIGNYIWPNKDWNNTNYTQEVNYFKNWLFGRLTWMDNTLDFTPVQPMATLSGVDDAAEWYTVKIKLTDNYFEHRQLERKHFSFTCSNSDAYIMDVIYQDAATANLRIAGISTSSLLGSSLKVTISDEVLTGYQSLTTNQMYLSTPGDLVQEPIHIFASGNQITVKHPAAHEPLTLAVFNKTGQLVMHNTLEPGLVSIVSVNLPTDIYVVKISGNHQVATQKIFINGF